MKKLVILLAGAAALGACATNNADDMGAMGSNGAMGGTMAQAAVDTNNPLFHPMYMTMAASSDMFEIQSSQLALQASQNPAVRNYANMMIAHHQATTQNLMTAAQSARLTPPTPMLVPMHQQMLDQLRSAGAGASFDAAYKQAQLMSHQEALNLHSGYAQGGDVAALRQVAAAAVPIVQQHLQQAQVLNVTPMMMNDGSMGQQPMGQQPSGAGRAGERG